VSGDGGVPFNYAFVTSTLQTPSTFGGLAGADTICNNRARDASLPGTFVAWLSTATVTAPSRLGSARGWFRPPPDGLPFADSVASLLAGEVLYPLGVTETGAVAPLSTVATGTNDDGTLGSTCGDWTGGPPGARPTLGTAGRGAGWSADPTALSAACTNPFRIYCFGIDRTYQVTVPPPAMARRAFVSTLWDPTTGRAAADTLCAQNATAQSLSGTFLAFLATTSESAMQRFTAATPWARLDNVMIVNQGSDLLAASPKLVAPFEVLADGKTRTPANMFTGAANPTQVGLNSYTCNNWANQSSTSLVTDSLYSISSSTNCTMSRPVFCLEQ
jgi:hypothetical protein